MLGRILQDANITKNNLYADWDIILNKQYV